MKPVDRYIHDVMACVFAPPGERQRFESDLRAHFADAEAREETPVRIIEGLGKPEDVAAAFNAEQKFQFAGFWRRLVAFCGDLGVTFAVAFVPTLTFLALSEVAAPVVSRQRLPPAPGRPAVEVVMAEPSFSLSVGLVISVIAFVGVALFYFPLLEWRFGKTLGKHLVRIRVVRETGAPIGLGQAFVRRLSYYFEMLAVDALFIPFTDKKQRALDIIAKTIVAREPGETAPWWGWVVCLALPAACLLALSSIAMLWPRG